LLSINTSQNALIIFIGHSVVTLTLFDCRCVVSLAGIKPVMANLLIELLLRTACDRGHGKNDHYLLCPHGRTSFTLTLTAAL
jgi:hypothetical protein